MKNSGIDWIGVIPDDWEIGKIGHLYTERKQKVSDKDYEPLSVTKQGILPQLETAAKTDAHDDRKLVKGGDFVINSRSDRRGSCGISDRDGSVSLINTVLIPRNEMNPHYFNWLFHSSLFSDEFYKWGHGIVDDLWTTNWLEMKSIFIPIPPKVAQEKISLFLDKKCSEIDELIIKNNQTIEEYKNLRQQIITNAITKGIKKNIKLKDSGVNWIGEIPEHWELKKLKFVSKTRKEKYTTKSKNLDYFALENIESKTSRFVETANVYDISQSQLCKKGDIVFGKLRPYLAKVYEVPKEECCSTELAVFYDFDGLNQYFKYVLLSYWFVTIVNASTYGTKMPRANIDDIKNMLVPIPPVSEQKEIIEYLDLKCNKIDKLTDSKKIIVKELENLKKAIIYEYVTGKKEVK